MKTHDYQEQSFWAIGAVAGIYTRGRYLSPVTLAGLNCDGIIKCVWDNPGMRLKKRALSLASLANGHSMPTTPYLQGNPTLHASLLSRIALTYKINPNNKQTSH